MINVKILEDSLKKCLTSSRDEILDVLPYSSNIEEKENQFMIFLKPEVTALLKGVQFTKIATLLYDLCKLHNVSITACSIIPEPVNRNQNIIQKNYADLNDISLHGLSLCSHYVSKRLLEYFPHISSDRVYGGHQFLKEYKDFSAKDLNALIQNSNTQKLGHGIYASEISIDNEAFLLLNGFYPSQLQHLQQPDSCLVVFSCLSDKPWKYLRNNFIGNIHPESAVRNSFRREVFENQQQFGLQTIDIGHNAIHISPGPIETIYQLQLFFGHQTSFNISELNFNKYLNDLTALVVNSPLQNIHLGRIDIQAKLYEITEDMGTMEAINFLRTHDLLTEDVYCS